MVAGFLVAFGAWFWVSHSPDINPALLPTPERVWISGLELWRDGNLQVDVAASFLRCGTGSCYRPRWRFRWDC